MQYSGKSPLPPLQRWLRVALFLGIFTVPCFTQVSEPDPCAPRDHLGTEFVVGFLEAMSPGGHPYIYIVGSHHATPVTIYSANNKILVDITHYTPVRAVDLFDHATPGSGAILVTTKHEVSVYGIDRGNSMDAFLALPVDALGTEYYVMSYDISPVVMRDNRGSQFMVMAVHQNTRVKIRLTSGAICNGELAGTHIDVTLNKLGTIHCISRDYDLTGTHIIADKPVGTLSGNKCAYVPNNQRYCDHLVEQLPPVSSWGYEFITSPLKGRSRGDRFRVMAARNNTLVRTTTSAGSFILQAGEFREFEVGSNSSAAVVSDQPTLLVQYSKGGNVDGTGADPFMMIVPAIDQYVSEAQVPYITDANDTGFTSNVNIIIDCEAKTNLLHSIFHFPENHFQEAPPETRDLLNRRFCYAQQTISPGHFFFEDRFSGFNSFTVLVYGYSGLGNEAYGMPGGLVLRNNSCPRSPMRLTSTVPPGYDCPTVGPPVRQIDDTGYDNDLSNNLFNDDSIPEANFEPTSGLNLNKYPSQGKNYLTVAIIIAMLSSVIITILAIYICVLKRKIRQLEMERKDQLQLSSMLVGPDGYIDLDGSQIPQREYMTLNNTDGVWRVGKVRRGDRAMFRSLSATNGKSNPGNSRCNGHSSNTEGTFRERRLPTSESAPHEMAGGVALNRQPSTSESCGGMSQNNGSTAALISISRQGSITEEPRLDSFPILRPVVINRPRSKHTSMHLDTDAHPDLIPTRHHRKHLWRSVSNPGVNPFSSVHGNLKVHYEVPKNNRPLTTGTVNSTFQNYDRPPRQRTSSEEISPAVCSFLTQFPNSLSSRQDDGYMSMKDPRASVSSQASGSQHGDLTSASNGACMMDKAYTSIPDENFNNANDAGDTDSTDYTELY